MGFLSGSRGNRGKGGGDGFNWGNAALGFFGGPSVARSLAERRRLEAEAAAAQAEAEQEAQLRAQAAQAMEAHGAPKSVIQGMRPEEISRYLLERYQTRQFGAGGGSSVTPGFGDAAPTTVMGPSRHEYQGTVFDVPGGPGEAVLRRRGVQAVPLQPGGEVAFVDSWEGREATGGGQQPPQSQGGQSEAELIAAARRAVERGADPQQVYTRLQELLRQRGGR